MTIRTSVVALAAALLLASMPTLAAAQIAVICDGGTDLCRQRTAAISKEVRQLSRDDPKPIAFPTTPTHVGDFTLPGIRAQLKNALSDRSVKAIIGLGLLTGIAVAELDMPPAKPIILPYSAPRVQGLPQGKTGSGVRNLAYISGLFDFESDIKRFREVIRDRKVGFLVDAHTLKIFLERRPPDLPVPGEGDDSVVLVPIPPTAEGAIAALPDDVEAVYLIPHFRMSFDDMGRFIDLLKEKGLPSYAGAGPEWVERGAFVTLVPDDLDTERFRRTALYLRDALAGESLSTLSTTFVRRTELVINMGTARALGIFPRFELMTEARLVGQNQKEKGPELTLKSAVEEALANNPAQQALREQREAAKAELRESRGNLLPRIDATGAFNWIDPDAASEFFNAERQLSWGATAQQVLYSPLAFSAYFAQDDLVDAVGQSVRTGRLDLILETVQSYLRLLQTEAIERLNRQNLLRVRTNRGLAELRVEIGTSGRQDIARWDIELADGRAETIQASANRNQAEIDVNRILAVPIERSFSTVDPDKGSSSLLIDPRANRYVQDLYSFKIYRAFMAEEALRNSPELRELDHRIEAQDNLIEGYVIQLYVPTVATSFGVTHIFNRGGVGAEDADPAMAPIPRDDFTWQWGVNLNFTLFDDSRYGTIDNLRRIRAQLMRQREDIANRVEQGVRSALHQAGASGAAVALRRDAVDAARVNLDAVTGAYRQGTTNIITLIDAQNQALSTEINAANALYQYLSDFAAAERASGRFLFMQSDLERDGFFQRLDAYAADKMSMPKQENPR